MDFTLPLSKPDAIALFRRKDASSAQQAYAVAQLFKSGLSNSQIRHKLKIDKVYTVTHLKRAGNLKSDELLLWHKNPQRIRLGHIRTIATLPLKKRQDFLKQLLQKSFSVAKLRNLIKNEPQHENPDIRLLEEHVATRIGRPVTLTFDSQSKNGNMNLAYFGIDDLENLVEQIT